MIDPLTLYHLMKDFGKETYKEKGKMMKLRTLNTPDEVISFIRKQQKEISRKDYFSNTNLNMFSSVSLYSFSQMINLWVQQQEMNHISHKTIFSDSFRDSAKSARLVAW